MFWKHQVFKCECEPSYGEEMYEVREVYYDDHNQVDAWSPNPIVPRGNSIDDLRVVLTKMLEACDDTILNESKLKLTAENEIYHDDTTYNRYDILDAYYSYYWRYMDDEQLTGRDRVRKTKPSIINILNSIGYIPLPWTVFQNMSENAKKIYDNLVYTYENVI